MLISALSTWSGLLQHKLQHQWGVAWKRSVCGTAEALLSLQLVWIVGSTVSHLSLLKISHRFHMGFRSGMLAGQSNNHCALFKMAFSSIKSQKSTFWIFIQLRWACCDLHCIFTVTDRFQPKKPQHGSVRELESFFWDWDGTGFSPSFFVGFGLDGIFFCGSGMGKVWKSTPVSPSTSHGY